VKYAFAVHTPAFQSGNGFQGQPHVHFALEWCTPITPSTGFKASYTRPPFALNLLPSIQQSHSYKRWDPANNDSVLACLQSWRVSHFFGEMPDSSHVHSNTCTGMCDGSRLFRGDMAFYLIQCPTKLRKSVLPWTPVFINGFILSLML
jgi:hypothetical protein